MTDQFSAFRSYQTPTERILEDTPYGGMVPYSEFPANDWGDGQVYQAPYVTLSDREDGKFPPFYNCESDLARMLGMVRRFIGLTELTEAVTTALRVYIFGPGVELSVQAAKGKETPPELVDGVRRIVERFSEKNNLVNNLDLEIHRRSRDDGECVLPLRKRGNDILCDPVETVQLTEPSGGAFMYEWMLEKHGIDCDAFVPSWKFGVLTEKAFTSRPIAYNIVSGHGVTDWETYSADELVHIKMNAPGCCKRGVSDWIAIKDRVSQQSKIARNMAHGGALQAAIAWVEESPAGTANGQLPNIGGPGGNGRQIPNGPGATRTQRDMTYGPGSILRPSPGRVYKAGPMGAERNEGFMVIENMLERQVGMRWLMTYPMISGDAAAVNFAASLTAEAPFVKARESDQQFFGGAEKSLLWKVVRMAWRAGWLDTRGIPISQLEQWIDINVGFTSPATRDRLQLVQQLQAEVALGATSKRTAAIELGRDYDEEKASMEQDKDNPAVAPTQQTPGVLSGMGARQIDVTRSRQLKVLKDFANGTIPSRVVAKGMLMGLSVSDADAEAYLNDAADGTIDTIHESILLESGNPNHGPDGKFGSGGGSHAFVPHPSAAMSPRKFVTIEADTAKLDHEWSKEKGHYIPSEGKGDSEIEGRRDDFNKFLESGRPIQQPHIVVNDSGNLAFNDGRHRTRVLIDKGLKTIPISVPKSDAAKVRALVGVPTMESIESHIAGIHTLLEQQGNPNHDANGRFGSGGSHYKSARTKAVSGKTELPSGGFETGSEVTHTLFSGSHEPIGEFNDHSYLTSDKSIAGEYGKHVSAAKVHVKKVFRPASVQEVSEASGIPAKEEHRFTFEELDRHAVRQALMDKGYDAVHFQDIAPNSPGDKTHDALIVFHGKNVKNITKHGKHNPIHEDCDPTLSAAIQGALESVESTEEAKQILEGLYP